MVSLNKVCLIGNLSRDVDFRTTSSGKSLSEFNMAINRGYGDNCEVCFVDIVAWGKIADRCKQYLKKGSCVFVEGYLQMNSWEDKETGKKRSRLKVVCESIQFLSSSGKNKNNFAEERVSSQVEHHVEDDNFAPPPFVCSKDDIPF